MMTMMMVMTMVRTKLARYLRDERGVETLEWIVVGGLIVGVAALVYGVWMADPLKNAINTILSKIK